MNKLLHNKKIIIPLIFFALVGLGSLSYTGIGIYLINKKVQGPQTKVEPYYPNYPHINANTQNIELIKRGEYLVKTGDCIACHTDTLHKGAAFAGGLAMRTPFGTLYAPNITPDKNTGIGAWTEQQFIKAMQQGISPTGHYYYPAFPFLYFSKIKKEDLIAIKAYLDNIPPVFNRNQKNEMVWPFNIRTLQLGWRLLFFSGKEHVPFKEQTQLSPSLNRGAYLVQGLGHCAMCHTPSYHLFNNNFSLGAPIRKYDLTGAKIDGYLAMNITQSNLQKVKIQEIIEVFTHNKMIGGGNVEGPMLEVNHDSLHYLSNNDLRNIASYLQTVRSETPPKPKGGPGKATYESYCSGCHATGSGSSPKFGDSSKWGPIVQHGFNNAYQHALHGIGNMPAKGSCLSCSDTDIKEAVSFMFNAVQGGTKFGNKPKSVPLNIADGRNIYIKNCSVCHDSGYQGAPKPGDQKAWQPIISAGFIKLFKNVALSENGHPLRGNCTTCTDAEIKAANKYLLNKANENGDYHLW